MLKNAHYRKKVIAFIKAKNIIRIKKYRKFLIAKIFYIIDTCIKRI